VEAQAAALKWTRDRGPIAHLRISPKRQRLAYAGAIRSDRIDVGGLRRAAGGCSWIGLGNFDGLLG